MIIFLYGEDDYRSREKLNKLKSNFTAKDASGMNMQEVDASKVDFKELKNAILASPFMGEKRLIIIEGLLSKKDKSLHEKILELIAVGIPESSVVVFWEEGAPDKRIKLFKTLSGLGKTEEVGLLSGQSLERWIAERVIERNGKINAEAITRLTAFVGNNLWQMSQEIDKLIIYKGEREIMAADVEMLVKSQLDTDIFSFVDALGRQDREAALRLLHDQFASGEHGLYLLTMIVYQFRNLLLVKSLLEKGVNPASIAREAKMHPFVAQKTTQQASNYSLEILKKIYSKLLDLDQTMKTSKMEPKMALDLLVVGLCG